MTPEIFKNLYHQYFDAIRNYLYYRSGDPVLATDISQEVFLQLWRKQPNLPVKKLKSLLYKIARDKFVDLIRKQKIREAHLETLSFAWENDDPETKLMLSELKNMYEKVLAQLPEKQRTVFLMNRKDGLTYREIAERLGLSIKTIEKRMGLTLSTLRKQLSYER